MARYVIRRVIFFLLTLIFTSILIFGLTRILPGDVCRIKLGGTEATPATVRACEQDLGLNDPLLVQYGSWAIKFIQGDFGQSFLSDDPNDPDNLAIFPELKQKLINSGRLAMLTLAIAVPISILLGVIAGLNENNPIDATISVVSLSFVSIPEFVTGLFLINVVALQWAVNWDWLPFEINITATGFDSSMSLWESMPFIILPAITGTLVILGYIARLTRAGVIEELKRDYVRTAELKGLPYWKVIIKHVMRNALLPTITVIAISIGWLMSGLVVIETVFGYPGVGQYLIRGVLRRDLPRIQAIVMVTVMIFLMVNFLADLMYAFLNPRIRLGE